MELRRKSLLTRVGTALMIAGGVLFIAVLMIFAWPMVHGPGNVYGGAANSSGSPGATTTGSSTLNFQLPTPVTAVPDADNYWPSVTYPSGNKVVGTGLINTAKPSRLVIPSLGIDADIQPVSLERVGKGRNEHAQWSVPASYAAGWHDQSAPLGQPGNTVLNGHNNIGGAIFRDLAHLKQGQKIVLYDQERAYTYEVVQQEYLREAGQPLKNRVMNARWILPTTDERVTLVTCWPNTSNSHRLVVIAVPVSPNS